MNNITLLIIILASFLYHGQTLDAYKKSERATYSLNSEIRVFQESDSVYDRFHGNVLEPAYFVNEILVNPARMRSIDPEQIEKINIEKGTGGSVLIEGVEYRGRINITLKPDYAGLEMEPDFSPQYITLQELVKKYVELDNSPFVFQIDDTVISKDFTTYKVDENFILKIIQNKIKTSDESVEINLIKIITKTSENIKKANTIMIRGTAVNY